MSCRIYYLFFNALDEVICVIIIEYSEQQKEFFEKEYNKKAAGILMGQIDSLKIE